MRKFRVVIPARLESTRFPGKLLYKLADKTLLQHVYEQATKSEAASVIIATDNEKICSVAKSFGATVCMTATYHQCGTERISEAVTKLGFAEDEVIVNLQADEVLIPPELISQVADNVLSHPTASMTTLKVGIDSSEQMFDPNVVKVVTDREDFALYFSRATIPWRRLHKDVNTKEQVDNCHHVYRHIGIYAYKKQFLQKFVNWSPSDLEKMESLEQLRVLSNGGKIHVATAVKTSPPGVDTIEDLDRLKLLRN